MSAANRGANRMIVLAVWGAVCASIGGGSAFAQSPDGGTSPATKATTTATALDRELERAEALFRRGHLALNEGRRAEAREALDDALDVFVEMRPAFTSDPRFQSSYRRLIDRIHAAEVSAGAPPPAPPLPQRVEPEALAAHPVEMQPPSTLAELGDRIEQNRATDEARRSNAAVLGSEVIDLPIELNDQVLGAIDLYKGRFNKWFSEALSRGLPHLPRIREILAQAGLPQDLAYVPIVESAFNPTALSRAKARGLWQFIPSTGKQYGLKQDFYIDERANIEKATLAAAQYLKNLYALFGDWNLALAGYNAGEGSVQRAIKKAQTNDFWALAKTRSFRSETKNYVPLIHAAIVIAKSPGSYGIDVSAQELAAVETVQVTGSYPVTTVARCAGAEPKDIRQFNPELRRGMTPSSAFDLKVPHGSGEQVVACLAKERTMNYTRHIIRERDTFSLIAKMFGVPASEIARVNGLTQQSRLRPGTELAIPRPSPSSPVKAATATGTVGLVPENSYRIRQGDTLSAIAVRHSTTVEALKALNGLSSSRLSIGRVLRVLSPSESSPE